MKKRNPLKLMLFGWVVFLLLANVVQAKSPQIIAIGEHIFKVEMAQSPDELRTGLMFRKSLAPDEGMLFVHNPPRQISMWMKNTEIDLDMLFIDENNKIIAIHTAKANDLRLIHAPKAVKYVLEINARTAANLNIKVGDLLQIK
jgi:uncharacterized protein